MKKKLITLLLCAVLSVPALGMDLNSPDMIKYVQESLNAVGYDCGTPDGVAGTGTNGQIEKYRADKGISTGSGIDPMLIGTLIEDRYDLKYEGDVPEDVTGNWRLSKYASAEGFENFALAYYASFVAEDSEIHAVINTATGTTYRVNIFPGKLIVAALKHVEGEEKSAKTLFDGDLISEWEIDTESGKMEQTRAYTPFEDFLAIAEPILQEQYGDRYKIEADGNLLSIALWSDGLAELVSYASAGYAEALTEYANFKSTVKSTAEIFTERLQQMYPDAHMLFSHLNDLNLDSALLMYLDGELYYDCLA